MCESMRGCARIGQDNVKKRRRNKALLIAKILKLYYNKIVRNHENVKIFFVEVAF